MRRTVFPWIVISSALAASTALAATRPHYGGTLHVQIAGTVSTLDQVVDQPDSLAVRNLDLLIFDTLVALSDRGQLQPALALSWQAESGNQRWQFVLRPGVRFSDQTPMTPESVASSLRRVNAGWKITASDTAITIQLDTPSPDLPAELALPRNSIVKGEGGKILGTGPFVAGQWDFGKKLSLSARDDYWNGRPFLDSVEIDMGRNPREEALALQMGQAQAIQLPPDQLHQNADSRLMQVSEPIELVALLFSADVRSPEEGKQRQALSLSIDRNLLNRVFLQGAGEPAGALLPDWLTGYGFLFSANANLPRAQQLRAELPQAPAWSLGFDATDPLARILAERITLNASDAGLRLQLTNQSHSDVRLVRVPLPSLDPHIALREIAQALGIPSPKLLGNAMDDLYHAENALVQSQRVIPLLYLRRAWAVSKNVRNWQNAPDGSWHLPEVWLAAGKP